MKVDRAGLFDMTEAEYHADPAPAPSPSASIAGVLLDASPLHAYTAHPRLGGVKRVPTQAMEDGSILHGMLLGKGAELEVIDADSFRTQRAKDLRDEARADGRIPVLLHHHAALTDAAEAIRENLAACGIDLRSGHREIAAVWEEETTHGRIWCRARLDHVLGATIHDLKKTRSGAPREAARSIARYGYDLQHAAYTRGLVATCPELADRVSMLLLFVEAVMPYAVVTIRLSETYQAIGARRWEQACELWAECLHGKRWPSYESATVEPPRWYAAEHEQPITFDGMEV